jgi:hypothetical protein
MMLLCVYHAQYIGELAAGSIDGCRQDPLEGIAHLLDGQVAIEKDVKRKSSTEELRRDFRV